MIAEKGVKRVGTAVSQEKGCLVTVCGTINAMGGFIPPFCIFPSSVNTQPLWEELQTSGCGILPMLEKLVTIHTIPILIAEAFPKAFTPTNIIAGFESTGIQPLNRERIPEHRYLPSYVRVIDQNPAESAMEPQQPEPSRSTHTPDEQDHNLSSCYPPICQGGSKIKDLKEEGYLLGADINTC
ncbi:hypothetical protein RRG08_007067 [Elysia crispata]|uniref:Uncharacterized protein n=1 Tax=Elysia crispata TaxID=231223 RepID=A0AAE1ABL1_9GAST|nr:hypothetical protein RRG08_007067 [Elysia crispata]